MNHLLIEALQRFHHYYGDTLKVRCPSRTGPLLTLGEVAAELNRRLCALFLPDGSGHRPYRGARRAHPDDDDALLFHEYFDGDTGEGLGAEHQTGWTGLVAKLLHTAPEGAR